MGRTLRVLGAAALVVGGTLATALPAAAEPSATIDDIVLEECDIVVTFTVGDAGEYHVEVWDDSEQIGDVPVTAEAGATVQARYTITAVVKQGASGLGIGVYSPDGAVEYDLIDPYNGADDVIDFCRSQDTTPEPTEPEPTTPTTAATAPASNTPAPAAAPPAPPATPVVTDPGYTG
jgi:hypothetical protein